MVKIVGGCVKGSCGGSLIARRFVASSYHCTGKHNSILTGLKTLNFDLELILLMTILLFSEQKSDQVEAL